MVSKVSFGVFGLLLARAALACLINTYHKECERSSCYGKTPPGCTCSWDSECISNSCSGFLGHCEHSTEGEECDYQSDCASGLYCESNKCIKQAQWVEVDSSKCS